MTVWINTLQFSLDWGNVFKMKGARLLIATQYGWHGVDNSHRLPWHCGVICSPEIHGGSRG